MLCPLEKKAHPILSTCVAFQHGHILLGEKWEGLVFFEILRLKQHDFLLHSVLGLESLVMQLHPGENALNGSVVLFELCLRRISAKMVTDFYFSLPCCLTDPVPDANCLAVHTVH